MKRTRYALAELSELNSKLVKASGGVRARFTLPTRIVLPLVACLLAIGLPNHGARATSGFSQNVTPADTPPTATEYPIPTPNSRSFQITAGPDGNFWFCENSGNKIGRVTTAGVFTEFPLAANSRPYGITGGPDGNMWFTEADGNKIGRIKTDFTSFTEFPIPTPGSTPSGITAGPDGNIWFAEAIGNKIGRVTVSGSGAGSITEFPLPFPGSVPFLLTPGPDGNVWFTLFSASNIGRITPSGSVTQFEIPTVNCEPSGITSGPDGNLWFTEYVGNKIGRITPFGVFTEFPIQTAGSLPFGITAAGDGNLYFTEQAANAVVQFVPATQTFGTPIRTSAGPSGIASLPPSLSLSDRRVSSIGSGQFLAFVAADANKFGIIAPTLEPDITMGGLLGDSFVKFLPSGQIVGTCIVVVGNVGKAEAADVVTTITTTCGKFLNAEVAAGPNPIFRIVPSHIVSAPPVGTNGPVTFAVDSPLAPLTLAGITVHFVFDADNPDCARARKMDFHAKSSTSTPESDSENDTNNERDYPLKFPEGIYLSWDPSSLEGAPEDILKLQDISAFGSFSSNYVAVAGFSGKARGRDSDETDGQAIASSSKAISFKVYGSPEPNVRPIAQNLFATIPSDQTYASVPATSADWYFVVTAVYPGGESAPSREVGGAMPTIRSVSVDDSSIAAKGSGFANQVQVVFAGVPFTAPAKVKKQGKKITQGGTLVTGQSLGEFMQQFVEPGATVFITFINSNGNGVAFPFTR